eukprot:CAMPEP_0176488040 /NCGR_PEP_ID=MMETSP0200_2-20121128/6479_1 /TAXON_ID=947934 /ORGANISM="Chaetoceros sp., Strain GSL56" /LENGTH=248 /DNA_ID=CAMNT_0017884961 /DNA_START=63 /DNA_END=806 /DNA_ORIENTATION=-
MTSTCSTRSTSSNHDNPTILHLQQLLELLLYPAISNDNEEEGTEETKDLNDKKNFVLDSNNDNHNPNIQNLLKRPALQWKTRNPILQQQPSSSTCSRSSSSSRHSSSNEKGNDDPSIMAYWKSPRRYDDSNDNIYDSHEGSWLYHDMRQGIIGKQDNSMLDSSASASTSTSTTSTIRHEDLLSWIRLCMYQLLQQCIASSAPGHMLHPLQRKQPIVAVAIPEGPYLAISILSLFVLNLLSSSSSSSSS